MRGEVGGDVQILLSAIGGCKNRITTVARRCNEELQRCGDFSDENDRGVRQRQWYDFCKQVWGGIHNQMAEQIQVLGPIVHKDVFR